MLYCTRMLTLRCVAMCCYASLPSGDAVLVLQCNVLTPPQSWAAIQEVSIVSTIYHYQDERGRRGGGAQVQGVRCPQQSEAAATHPGPRGQNVNTRGCPLVFRLLLSHSRIDSKQGLTSTLQNVPDFGIEKAKVKIGTDGTALSPTTLLC